MNEVRYIRINSDMWEDAGVVYKVNTHSRLNHSSTGVRLELEDSDGNIIRKVVPSHCIEWLDSELDQ